MDVLIPLILAAMPILLGQAMAGSMEAASANFQQNTGLAGANYIAFILIGANVFSSIMTAFWLFGLFIRREQMSGTLEALSMTPAHKISILGGLALYVEARSVFTFVLGYTIGCIVFGLNPLQGEVLLAVFILLLGLLPVFGLSFLLGALVLKVKQANSLFNTLQWALGIISGVFFPVTVLPFFIQILAFIFPGFYLTYGVQAALMGLNWFFGSLYLDLGVIFLFTLICPFIGYFVFSKTEKRSKKAEGIGQF
jgi:ABC-2 type transport system permease protein